MTAWRRFARVENFGLVAAILLGGALLTATTPNFLTALNLYVMLRGISVGILVALAQMIVLGIGQMNLAIGATGGLVAVALGALIEVGDASLVIAVPLCLAFGALLGLINGWLVSRTEINSVIITLATGSIFTGINLRATRSIPFYKMPPALLAIGDHRVGALPYLLVAPAIIAGALAIFYSRMRWGRWMLAFGDNPRAAELSGLPSSRIVVGAHMLSGSLAGLAAVLAAAQLGSAQPTIGSEWLLLSLAAPILGGASLAGGKVSVVGAVLAMLLIGLIENGLVQAKIDPYWVRFLLGALILAAVGLNRHRSNGATL